eukprot:scaffold22631_cov62-Phaeocystis_antarctica.AAC.2
MRPSAPRSTAANSSRRSCSRSACSCPFPGPGGPARRSRAAARPRHPRQGRRRPRARWARRCGEGAARGTAAPPSTWRRPWGRSRRPPGTRGHSPRSQRVPPRSGRASRRWRCLRACPSTRPAPLSEIFSCARNHSTWSHGRRPARSGVLAIARSRSWLAGRPRHCSIHHRAEQRAPLRSRRCGSACLQAAPRACPRQRPSTPVCPRQRELVRPLASLEPARAHRQRARRWPPSPSSATSSALERGTVAVRGMRNYEEKLWRQERNPEHAALNLFVQA